MICTGAVPGPMIQGIEMYNTYMRAMSEVYMAWCAMTGVTYWAEVMRNCYKTDNEE